MDFLPSSNQPKEGVWIGLDLGTSNSACAVWDSTRGSPKWMRLPDIAVKENTKWGRLVPSLIRVSQPPLIGAQAMITASNSNGNVGTLISSVKRLLGRTLDDVKQHAAVLYYEVTEDEHGNILLAVETTSGETIHLTPVQILGMLLMGMREAAERYLQKYATRKHLDVPGAIPGTPYSIRNVVIGVPAHFSKRQTLLVEEAARMGGFSGVVSTTLESTAAAMAYGLTLQESSNDSTIIVLDMGGGTSDITVARKGGKQNDGIGDVGSSASSYQVLVTEGEERLGGDDIDQELLDYCLRTILQSNSLTRNATVKLLKSCRYAKELLCDLESPRQSVSIRIENDDGGLIQEVEVDQTQFERVLDPWLDKTRLLINRALEHLHRVAPGTVASEMILVGGTTRIPAIRRMIQTEFFPNIEISMSLNPMSSVAQGLAIHAALMSKLVPSHQLRSALMLDCIPHAIGVLLGDKGDESSFVEILKRNAPLPATGSTTFTLADKFQPGVTIQAVEMVGTSPTAYEPIARDPFTFLLRRLSKDEYASLESRRVEVGMKVDAEGRFTVSVFDEMDPEQVRKRERFEREGHVIGYHQVDIRTVLRILWQDSHFSSDQFMLVGLLVASLSMYVAVKLAFSDDLLVGHGA